MAWSPTPCWQRQKLMTDMKNKQRVAELAAVLSDGRPRGVGELSAQFGMSRSTMKLVLHAGIPEHFAIYQTGTIGRGARETLYVLAADAPTELTVEEWPTWWARADKTLADAFRSMINCT